MLKISELLFIEREEVSLSKFLFALLRLNKRIENRLKVSVSFLSLCLFRPRFAIQQEVSSSIPFSFLFSDADTKIFKL
uniref:Uncharacterized protein n=1 Tax=Solanum lycopersicum TaxID=4081 RepID=A0A3Q7I3Q6_SOLLC